jgi:thiamine-phosphate pyrophosphorylase
MIRYAITDGKSCGSQEDILGAAGRWSVDGIDFVQLREKHRGAGDLVVLAKAMKQIFSTGGGRTRLLINGRPDVAVAAQADGVHLTARRGELTPAQVREVFAFAGLSAPVVSVSCHSVEEVLRAGDAGVDLILFGPVFEKRVDGELITEGVSLDMLGKACQCAGAIPVLALGGIKAENTEACVARGAAGVAAIRLFG